MYNVLISSNSFGYGEKRDVVEQKFYLKKLKPFFIKLENADHESLKKMDGLIVGTSKVTPQIIDCMENLKCIVKFGTGTDNIDIEYARSKGIVVKNLPAVNSASVAEFTVGMIFAVARRIPQGYANLQRGSFYKEIGTQVIGKLVGIVGTGNIGKQVAMMCKGLGLNVHVYDLYPDKEWANANGLKYVTFEYLLRTSDFITIHVPLLNETKNMIDEKELALMKSSAYLVNMSRGGIVNERALYEALVSRKIKGAAIDVFSEEPPTDNLLIKLDNVVATPHMAAHEETTLRKMDTKSIEIIAECLLCADA